MQPKLRSFFKPSSSSSSSSPPASSYPSSCDVTTYSRRIYREQGRESAGERSISGEFCTADRVLNRKRSYALLHLEFGQSDFNLRICSACGFDYAPGDGKDEKAHKAFHRSYTHGIQFRGWQNDRVIPIYCREGDRIVLVLDSDPSARTTKLKDVIKMMEIELGEGWIFHDLCKVYLYVSSSNRTAGCLVTEPINEAFKTISSSVNKKAETEATGKESITELRALKFGDVAFKREAVKKIPSTTSREAINGSHYGAMVCEERTVPAACGIRAIWVTPSNRRKGIATRLLDAARKSFCIGCTLERSQIAFSPPTSARRPKSNSWETNKT